MVPSQSMRFQVEVSAWKLQAVYVIALLFANSSIDLSKERGQQSWSMLQISFFWMWVEGSSKLSFSCLLLLLFFFLASLLPVNGTQTLFVEGTASCLGGRLFLIPHSPTFCIILKFLRIVLVTKFYVIKSACNPTPIPKTHRVRGREKARARLYVRWNNPN